MRHLGSLLKGEKPSHGNEIKTRNGFVSTSSFISISFIFNFASTWPIVQEK